MPELDLPDDLRTFLKNERQLEYDTTNCEVGQATLHQLDDLKSELFSMCNAGPDDPNKDGEGSYLVKAISLIADCENYDPEGLLVWLPLDKRYGLWDGEHGNLLVFANDVTWTDIACDFRRFIDAHWGEDDTAHVSDLEAWRHHNYNSEQVIGPLPDIEEWYEASWTRRGEYRDGIQLRFPEFIEVRIENHEGNRTVVSRYEPAKDEADWTPAVTESISENDWTKLSVRLDSDFWEESARTEYTEHGATETMWLMNGFREGKYASLFRSYDEASVQGDRVNELGMFLISLARFPRLEAKK